MTLDVLHMTAMKRDAVLNIRLPADVKAAVRRAAEDDFSRSVSSMVVRVLREWCVEKGYLTAPASKQKKGRN
jgi:hypothetical protein